MSRPPIKYAKNAAGLNIAYWTLGDGPPDLVYVPNFVTNVDLLWLFEPVARILRRLASVGRLTEFDTSGTGVSDSIPVDELPTMEQWMDDVRVVMDAEGIERATLISQDSGGPVAALFAATHPDRTAGLVLLGSYARMLSAPDYPWGYPSERRTHALDEFLEMWGTGKQLQVTGPTVADDAAWQEWVGVMERAVSVRMRRPLFEMLQSVDVRAVLPAVRVPTLVIHRQGDRYIRASLGRFLADNIEGAKYVELPGDDHYWFMGDSGRIVDEIRNFVIGAREDPQETDRVLATLMFTDIVDSTGYAARLGDRRWRELLDRHDEVVRESLRHFRGQEVKATGDGFLATFDGPARAIRCALSLNQQMSSLGIELRTGLHTGEVEQRGEDLGGIAVHIGARVMAEAEPSEILVTGSVPPLVTGSGITFEDQGIRDLRGIPGEWRLFAVRE
ncbi:MAG: alpha/beta fold hydrolase [Actinomycetota bacterium]|nr:adenylate/guanylate cyclase domain-containing protein [Actinomycetota bacterium]